MDVVQLNVILLYTGRYLPTNYQVTEYITIPKRCYNSTLGAAATNIKGDEFTLQIINYLKELFLLNFLKQPNILKTYLALRNLETWTVKTGDIMVSAVLKVLIGINKELVKVNINRCIMNDHVLTYY